MFEISRFTPYYGQGHKMPKKIEIHKKLQHRRLQFINISFTVRWLIAGKMQGARLLLFRFEL